MGKLQTADKIISFLERLHWGWGLLLSFGGSLVTALLGELGKIPLMWIWVAMLIAFAACISAWHHIRTPSGKKKAKRDAVFNVCGETFRLTETFKGDKTPFFVALNQACAVFGDDDEVQKVLKRLKEQQGHEQLLLPDLIETMAKAANVKIQREHIKIPFTSGIPYQ